MKPILSIILSSAITASVMLNLFAYCPQHFQRPQENATGFIPASLPVKTSKGDARFKSVLQEAANLTKMEK